MIRDLDETLRALVKSGAAPGSPLSKAEVSFELPDSTWRASLSKLTVNCYLYAIHEARELRTAEPIVVRTPDGKRAARVSPPVRIECSYCITAWSPATLEPVLEEHRLLSQVLVLLLRHPTLPAGVLQGSLKTTQVPPFPTVVASQDGVKNQPDFWHALDQKLKPSLNYAVTLGVHAGDAAPATVVEEVRVRTEDLGKLKKP